MCKWNREGLGAILTAISLIITAAFSPIQARGAWWCTAFAIVCEEAAAEPSEEEKTSSSDPIVLKWKVAEWWESLHQRR